MTRNRFESREAAFPGRRRRWTILALPLRDLLGAAADPDRHP
jgi:hypothetical protein